MGSHPQVSFEPRKTPVQARSAVTVEAILKATLLVFIMFALTVLTTTASPSVPQYRWARRIRRFRREQALLFSVMEQRMGHVGDAMVQACQRNHGEPVATMVGSVVERSSTRS